MSRRLTLLELAMKNTGGRTRLPVPATEPSIRSLCGYTPSWLNEAKSRESMNRVFTTDVMDVDAWARRNHIKLFDG